MKLIGYFYVIYWDVYNKKLTGLVKLKILPQKYLEKKFVINWNKD